MGIIQCLYNKLNKVSVNAKLMQVWKESSGVFTANPTKISNANLLEYVTPDEANELTNFGNEVLHPYTMKTAMENKVTIEILNTFEPNEPGTTICDHKSKPQDSNSDTVKAICSKKGVNVINFNSKEYSLNSKLFELFDKHGIKADLISTSIGNISMAIHESVKMTNIDQLITDLEKYGKVNLVKNRSIVTCIGNKMKNNYTATTKLFQTLIDNNIDINMVSQGSSDTNISVVIPQNDMDKAVEVLHDHLIEQPKLYE